VGGYEYFIPVSDNIFLGTGLYAKYGLTNAFSGNQQIPEYLNRTHNAAFIFSLSINYEIN
jgi:long-subunit fatty acid transport protein